MPTATHDTIDDERLDRTFAALANTTRRRILSRLAAGDASVNELAEPFDLTLPAVSKHIKVLESAGLVTRTRRAQYRPCALDPDSLVEVTEWVEQQRAIWNGRLDQLDHYLDRLQADDPHHPGADS